MAFPAPLSSPANPRIRRTASLRRRSGRNDHLFFLIEGRRELKRALQNGVQPETVFFSIPQFEADPPFHDWILSLDAAGVDCQPCTAPAFRKIAYREETEGIVAVARVPQWTLSSLDPFKHPGVLVVVDQVEKPGNLGAILRCADGAGANAVIVCDAATDPYNPNVVRASLGALFCLPVICAPRDQTVAFMHRNRIRLMAATPHADPRYTAVDMTQSVAFVLGSEQTGLDPEWLSQADDHVRIPMCGQCDSLNVATAAALLLYECLRQRTSIAKNAS